jgi:hypothetical protein
MNDVSNNKEYIFQEVLYQDVYILMVIHYSFLYSLLVDGIVFISSVPSNKKNLFSLHP